MSELPPTPDATHLLRDATRLRGLARRLVADASLAEDAIQEAWLSALRSPRRHESSAGGWWAAVVKNAARRITRNERARLARERRVARPEIVNDTPADVVARAEAHESLVKHVLALAEPYRRVLLWRYFDGFEPREIAAHLDVPASTVRSQVRRGQELRRPKLDQEHRGGRDAWTRTFLLLVQPDRGTGPTQGTVVGELAMGTASKSTLLLTMGAALLLAGTLVAAGLDLLADAPTEAVDRSGDPTAGGEGRSGPGAGGPHLAVRKDEGEQTAEPGSGAAEIVRADSRVDALITRLVKLDARGIHVRFRPNARLSGSLSSKSAGGSALLQLIELGPAAVPSLLEALDDERKTGLTLPEGRGIGFQPAPLSRDAGDLAGTGIETYTVRVGDVCYAALGQIVARRDLHFFSWGGPRNGNRTQLRMTIRSPVLNAERRAAVRRLFDDGANPDDVVFRLLRTRFESGSRHLAPRLLHYFPVRALEPVLEELRSGQSHPEFFRLVGYVAPFKSTAVQSVLLDVLIATRDMQVLDACLTEHVLSLNRELVGRTLGHHLASPPPNPNAWQFNAQHRVLEKAVRWFPEDARRFLTMHGNLTNYRCRTAALVAIGDLGTSPDWIVPYLARFLDDKTSGWRGYRVKRDRHAMRVCDVAAVALAKHLPDAQFRLDGGAERLDTQIEALRELVRRRGDR